MIIIKAENAEIANALAEDKGLYFDGCEQGYDCSCCGDRWYRAYRGYDEPTIYDWKVDFNNVEKFITNYKKYDEFKSMPIIKIYRNKYNTIEEY